MAYNETDPVPMDLDFTTPTEGATTPSEVNNAIREMKRCFKNEHAVIAKTAAYTMLETDFLVRVTNATTITLPPVANVSSSTFTRAYCIVNDGSGVVTIEGNGSEQINGGLNIKITDQYGAVFLYANGTNWRAVGVYDSVALTTPTIAGGTITSPTIVTPTIADLSNMTHDHADAAGGGTITGLVPTGMSMPWNGAYDAVPSGYLLENGQAVSRTTYSVLFGVIGTAFGVGDGSTTFNVPDSRGRVRAGMDNPGGGAADRITDAQADSMGGAMGAEDHQLTEAELAAHAHATQVTTTLYGANGHVGGNTIVGPLTTSSAGGDTAHNNVQPTLFSNWVIKT